MKFRCTHNNHKHHESLDVYLNGKLSLTIKNIQKMATISIDIEDNAPALATALSNFKTAYDALQAAPLSGLGQALTDLTAANDALRAFQITFTASVPAPPAA